MTARLIIHYRGAGRPLSWLAEDERGRILAGPSDDVALPAATLAGAREVVVLVPGEDVLLAETTVAARSRDQLARAVPFALEDQLAEPVEALHFAVLAEGPRSQRVAVVRRDRMAGWLADLAAAGIRPDLLVPETAAVPLADDAPVVVIEQDRALVRMGPARAVVVAPEELAMVLAHADGPRDADGRPLAHLHIARTATNEFRDIAAIGPARYAHVLDVLAAGLRTATAVPNLASGEFAARHRGVGARRDWRLAAMLAAALVVLAVTYQVADRLVLARRAQALDAQMRSLYRETFPAATRITADVRAQMQGELARMDSGTRGAGVLPLLERVAPMLTNGTQHQLRGIEYRNQTLELLVQAPAVATLDSLRESVATLPGIKVELASATTTEQGAEGRLRIREAAP